MQIFVYPLQHSMVVYDVDQLQNPSNKTKYLPNLNVGVKATEILLRSRFHLQLRFCTAGLRRLFAMRKNQQKGCEMQMSWDPALINLLEGNNIPN